MIHKDLCDAEKTNNWTSGQILFHLFLTRCHRWNGEIPYTIREIARELKCSESRVAYYINCALKDNILFKEKNKYCFTKKIVNGNEVPYVKNFEFLHGREFANEEVNVQRFVLHMLRHGVYNAGMFANYNLKNLYHKMNKSKKVVKKGIFNVYYKSQMQRIINRAKKYLVINDQDKEIIVVTGIQDGLKKVIKNSGEIVALKKKLRNNNIIYVEEKTLEEIIKVNARYRDRLCREETNYFSNKALESCLRNTKFVNLLLSNNSEEVRLYYSAVCDTEEFNYALELSERLICTNSNKDDINTKIENLDKYWCWALSERKCEKYLNLMKDKISELPLLWGRLQVYSFLAFIKDSEQKRRQERENNISNFTPYNWFENTSP